MKSLKNPDLYWRIRELAVMCRSSVGTVLKEAKISTATVHSWTHGGKKPRPTSLAKIYEAVRRLRERNSR